MLQTFWKCLKKFDEFCWDFQSQKLESKWKKASGAKVWQSCRSRKMLQDEYLFEKKPIQKKTRLLKCGNFTRNAGKDTVPSLSPIFQANTVKYSNFRELVLFCIEADFCDQGLILWHFLAFSEIYKIITPLHRSKFNISAKPRTTFDISGILIEFLQNIRTFQHFSSRILIKFCWNFAEYSRKFSKYQNVFKILRKFLNWDSIFTEFWSD